MLAPVGIGSSHDAWDMTARIFVQLARHVRHAEHRSAQLRRDEASLSVGYNIENTSRGEA